MNGFPSSREAAALSAPDVRFCRVLSARPRVGFEAVGACFGFSATFASLRVFALMFPSLLILCRGPPAPNSKGAGVLHPPEDATFSSLRWLTELSSLGIVEKTLPVDYSNNYKMYPVPRRLRRTRALNAHQPRSCVRLTRT